VTLHPLEPKRLVYDTNPISPPLSKFVMYIRPLNYQSLIKNG